MASIKIILDKTQKEYNILPHVVPIFTKVKTQHSPLTIGNISDENMDIICQTADEFSRLSESERKKYDTPDKWEADSSEQLWYDKTFKPLTIRSVLDIANTTNALGFEILLNVSCFCIAEHIKGKSPEVIREMLQIENDLTSDEIDEIRNETSWFS